VAFGGKMQVFCDDELIMEFADDVIWQTMPKLAQLRSKGKQLKFKQITDNNETYDFSTSTFPAYFDNYKRIRVLGLDTGITIGSKDNIVGLETSFGGTTYLITSTGSKLPLRDEQLNLDMHLLDFTDLEITAHSLGYEASALAAELLREYFPDCEGRPEVVIIHSPPFVASTRHNNETGHTYITLNSKYLVSEDLRQILAHEVVHYYIYEMFGDTADKENVNHGDLYKDLAEEINKQEGHGFIGSSADTTKWDSDNTGNSNLTGSKNEALTDDELSTICRWVESSSNDQVRLEMLALKNMLPVKYRKVLGGKVYRGVAASEETVAALDAGKHLRTQPVESWSESKAVASNFMFDTGYPYGAIFECTPGISDVIVNINMVAQCSELHDESEIILSHMILSKKNLVGLIANKGFDGRLRQDSLKIINQVLALRETEKTKLITTGVFGGAYKVERPGNEMLTHAVLVTPDFNWDTGRSLCKKVRNIMDDRTQWTKDLPTCTACLNKWNRLGKEHPEYMNWEPEK
jgi:hypothetical protein